ncbi:MAG: GNAT family N-acetyltransferase [Armatimonas sp.]
MSETEAPPNLLVADPLAHRDVLILLNIEYLSWVFTGIEQSFGVPADEIAGMPVEQYVPTAIDKVCGDPPPKGIFYLLQTESGTAGMGGLRFLRPGVAEIKRVYVRPEYRGRKLGELILQRLLADATTFGYERVCLDTAPFMTAAHRLYECYDFTDCAAYEGVEVPSEFHSDWRFMERTL